MVLLLISLVGLPILYAIAKALLSDTPTKPETPQDRFYKLKAQYDNVVAKNPRVEPEVQAMMGSVFSQVERDIKRHGSQPNSTDKN